MLSELVFHLLPVLVAAEVMAILCQLNLNYSSNNVGANGATFDVTVSSSQGFSSSDDSSWISTSKVGNKIRITVDNNNGGSRSGTVTISGCQTKTFSVSQSGGSSSCSVSTSQSSLNYLASQSTKTFQVTTSEGYSVSDNSGWVSTSKSGNTVSVTVTANNSNSSRSATITINGCENKTVSVSQSGQSLGGGGTAAKHEAED